MSVERFFQEAERRLEGVETERRAQLTERLALARAMLGTLDPFSYLEEWLAPRSGISRNTAKLEPQGIDVVRPDIGSHILRGATCVE